MKRPEITKELIIEGLKKNTYISAQFEDEELFEDIAECYIENKPYDGYEFMKELEERPYYWSGDLAMCELLEDVKGSIESIYIEYLKEWVQENNIKPMYKPGDEVPGTDIVIADVYDRRPFTYLVQFKSDVPKVGWDWHRIMWFDEVENQEK